MMKFTSIATILFVMVLALCACSKEIEWAGNTDSPDTQFSIASIGGFTGSDDPMNTRSGFSQPQTTDTIDLGDDYAILAETYSFPAMDFQEQDTPLTRGTLAQEPGQIKNMNIMAFNSGANDLSATTPLSAIITATLTNGNWNNNKGFVWPLQSDKISFFAITPAATIDNGMSISDDGRVLTYTAPEVTANQPDICWATPVLNRTNPENSGNHLIKFNMKHRLSAVGLMAMGNYLKINKVTLSNVLSSGKLDTQTGDWSEVGGKKSFDIGVAERVESLVMTDVTKNDGYVLLPPQSFNNDAMLTIVFDDTKSGKTNITKTVRLKSYTGGKWDVGKLILYRMIFKGSYPLTVTPASAVIPFAAGSKMLDYTTSSPMPIVLDTDVPWITLISAENGKITFSYTQSLTNRYGNIYVSTGYTTVKVPVSQVSPAITVSAAQRSIEYRSNTFYVTLTSSVPWKVSSATNANASPASGGAGTYDIRVSVPENSNYIYSRSCEVNFVTTSGYTDKSAKWNTTQRYKYPDGYYPDHIPELPAGLFVARNGYFVWSYSNYEYPRDVLCPNSGGRVPTVEEAQKMAKFRSLYSNINERSTSDEIWTNQSGGKHWLLGEQQYVVQIGSLATRKAFRKDLNVPRCVRRMN